MKILDMEQRTPEWFAARRGIPTASSFDKIITSTGKPSTQAKTYMNSLLAEWLIGDEIDEGFTNEWMERGVELEARGRANYELETGTVLSEVGFVLHETIMAGCSPDGLSEDGGFELKCPKSATHVEYMLGKRCPPKYIQQVQGCMWICERDHWDFASYHPQLPLFIVRVERDEKFIDRLRDEILSFTEGMAEKRTLLTGGIMNFNNPAFGDWSEFDTEPVLTGPRHNPPSHPTGKPHRSGTYVSPYRDWIAPTSGTARGVHNYGPRSSATTGHDDIIRNTEILCSKRFGPPPPPPPAEAWADSDVIRSLKELARLRVE